MQYSFILQDNTKKAYRLFVWFLFFFHIVAAGVIGLSTGDKQTKTGLYIFFGLLTAAAIIYSVLRKQKNALDVFSVIMALLCIVFWVRYGGVAAAIIFAAVFLFVLLVQQKKTMVVISTEGVMLKRVFRETKYPWQKLDHVILKDGLLTIDLASNRMIQAELAEENKAVDETEFNGFCKQHLQNNT